MNCTGKKICEIVKGKKVLFITTKNIDYIRNTQELRLLKESASNVEIIYSDAKNYVLRVLAVWRKISRRVINRNDIIFLGFSPQLVMPFMAKRLKGKKIIIDFFISVYDTLICDRRNFKANGLVAWVCHSLDNITLKKANHVITDTQAHAEYFITEFNCNKDIFETIYLEADPMVYYSRMQSKSVWLEDKFIVLYFGSILPLQGVNIVLNAIREFKNEKDIYFDVIGPIPKKYDKPIQSNVGYTEWLTQEELAERIAQADLCLAGHFSAEIDKAKRTIPGKAYIYEMMGKTMILGDGPANHELFVEDARHHFVAMGDDKALIELIKRGYSTWSIHKKKN